MIENGPLMEISCFFFKSNKKVYIFHIPLFLLSNRYERTTLRITNYRDQTGKVTRLFIVRRLFAMSRCENFSTSLF